MNRFRFVLERELFRLYFTSLSHVDRDVSNIRIDTPSSAEGVSSIKYLVQIISRSSVVQELTITRRYSRTKTMLCINTHMPLRENGLPAPDKSLTYPSDTDINVEITRFEDVYFCVSVNGRVVGFIDTPCENRACFETVVKCFVMTEDTKKQKEVSFELPKPVVNKGAFRLRLTHQYMVSLCRDIKKAVDHFVNIGVVRLKFDREKTTLCSTSVHQKHAFSVTDTGTLYTVERSHRIY